MSPQERRIRVALTVLYFMVAYGILSGFSYGSYFCDPARTGRNHALTTVRLALACTVWDLFASACGALAVVAIRKYVYWPGIAPLVSAIVAGAGFFYMPLWIN